MDGFWNMQGPSNLNDVHNISELSRNYVTSQSQNN